MTKTGGLFLTNKKITETAAIAAAAVVLGYLESLIPLGIPIPGVKLGLSNLAVLFALYRVGAKNAAAAAAIKVIVSSLLFSGVSAGIYAGCGGFLSYFAMFFSKKFFSPKFVSISGGIFHNIGQLAAAVIILKSSAALWYMPYLILSGAVTGFLVGIACEILLKKLK